MSTGGGLQSEWDRAMADVEMAVTAKLSGDDELALAIVTGMANPRAATAVAISYVESALAFVCEHIEAPEGGQPDPARVWSDWLTMKAAQGAG